MPINYACCSLNQLIKKAPYCVTVNDYIVENSYCIVLDTKESFLVSITVTVIYVNALSSEAFRCEKRAS